MSSLFTIACSHKKLGKRIDNNIFKNKTLQIFVIFYSGYIYSYFEFYFLHRLLIELMLIPLISNDHDQVSQPMKLLVHNAFWQNQIFKTVCQYVCEQGQQTFISVRLPKCHNLQFPICKLKSPISKKTNVYLFKNNSISDPIDQMEKKIALTIKFASDIID